MVPSPSIPSSSVELRGGVGFSFSGSPRFLPRCTERSMDKLLHGKKPLVKQGAAAGTSSMQQGAAEAGEDDRLEGAAEAGNRGHGPRPQQKAAAEEGEDGGLEGAAEAGNRGRARPQQQGAAEAVRTTGSRERRRPGISGGRGDRVRRRGVACGDERQGIGLRLHRHSILLGPLPPPPPPAQRQCDRGRTTGNTGSWADGGRQSSNFESS